MTNDVGLLAVCVFLGVGIGIAITEWMQWKDAGHTGRPRDQIDHLVDQWRDLWHGDDHLQKDDK